MGILRAAANVIRNPHAIRQYYHYVGKSVDPEGDRIKKWAFGAIDRTYVTDVFPGIENVGLTLVGAFDRNVEWSLDTLEVCVLCGAARLIEARNVMEIGTFDGSATVNLAANTPPDAKIVTVDLPPDWSGEFELVVSQDRDNSAGRNHVGEKFVGHEYSKKISQIYCDSAKLPFEKLDTPFDFYFIDGCHDRAYVKIDTDNAIKNTRKGGLIFWHDYGFIQDVSDVVDEYADRLNVKVVRGTRLAVGFV